MGILDDAIREHLELKRAHGANEDELRRKEAEAFGPVRQDAAPVAAEPAYAEQHTQLLSPEDVPQADDAAPLEALQPAPDDPYAVHPGDDLVPDEHNVHPEPEHHDVSPAAEAGAGMLEPHTVDAGPPITPHHHHDEQHPALADHDRIHSEEHAPEPVF